MSKSCVTSLALCGLVASAACGKPSWRSQVTAEGLIDRPDGPSLFYRVLGTGADTAIVLHGGSLHQGYLFDPLADLIEGRTLIFYDQRGRGRSATVTDTAQLSFDADVADLEAVRARFKLDRPLVIGHHWGAAVGAIYAARHPGHVSRLLLLSPYPVIYSWFYELNAVPADTAKYRALLAVVRPDITAEQAPEYCRDTWPIFFSPLRPDVGTPYDAMASAVCDLPADKIVTSQRTTRAVQRSLGQWVFRPELNRVEVPTLVIEGSGSPLVAEAATRWAQHLIDARVLLLQPPYLFPWVGDPTGFREATSAFLAGAWPPRSVRPERWLPPT